MELPPAVGVGYFENVASLEPHPVSPRVGRVPNPRHELVVDFHLEDFIFTLTGIHNFDTFTVHFLVQIGREACRVLRIRAHVHSVGDTAQHFDNRAIPTLLFLKDASLHRLKGLGGVGVHGVAVQMWLLGVLTRWVGVQGFGTLTSR